MNLLEKQKSRLSDNQANQTTLSKTIVLVIPKKSWKGTLVQKIINVKQPSVCFNLNNCLITLCIIHLI